MEKEIKISLALIILLFLISILTKFYGATDTVEYTSVAKYFAGAYAAKIRTSHSLIYGIILSPFVKIFNSFLGAKIFGALSLIAIIISLFYISRKDKRVLLLSVSAPIVWYIAPVISPIQLSAL